MSIRTRALLAVALLVGFYALALGIVAGLVYLPYAEWRYVHRVDLRLVVFCGVSAFAIARALVPRRDAFEPPGPELRRAEHPKLFGMIDDVARQTGQAPPAEVYLLMDVNAWVAERGGVMGAGARRVMGVGLPLLDLLTVSQFRAVVAHEFGHFVGGDTRLGPWIYKTRAAIGRTLEGLEGHGSLLGKPFEWYGLLFLRVTHAVSRRQEYVADAVAARVAGKRAAMGALREIEAGAMAFAGYWRSEVAPTLSRGYHPPIVAGLRQFIAAPSVAPQLAEHLDTQLREGKADRYDTHPSLRERLEALAALPEEADGAATGDGDDGAAPALALLANPEQAEQTLVAELGRREAAELRPITWDEVPNAVLPTCWAEVVAPMQAGLTGLRADELSDVARDPRALAVRLGLARSVGRLAEHHPAQAEAAVGAALALALHERALGGAAALHAPPGEPVTYTAGATTIRPFAIYESLASGTLSAADWAARCAAAGIAGVDLGAVAARASGKLRPSMR